MTARSFFSDSDKKVVNDGQDYSKEIFNNEIQFILEKKAINSKILSYARYTELLGRLRRVKNRGLCTGNTADYSLIKRYNVKKIDSEYRIINRKTGNIMVYVDEMYDIIKEAHLATKHGGRDMMMSKLKLKYGNITTEMVVLFLEVCQLCQQKREKVGWYCKDDDNISDE